MSQIIVSYQPDHHQWLLNRLEERLYERFGRQNVCFGVEQLALDAGQPPHPDDIEEQVRGATMLIVVIGQEWLYGDWFNDPEDPDHIAIVTALQEDIRLVPLLVNDAELPASSMLPRDLARLGRRIPLTMNDETFYEDIHDLFESIERYIDPQHPAGPPELSFSPPQRKASRAVNVPSGGASTGSSGSGGFQTGNMGSFTLPTPNGMPLFIRALLNPFSDQQWLPKIGIGMIAALIPIVGTLALTGYAVRMAQGIRRGGPALPAWDDIGGDLIRGFVTVAGTVLQALIWFIPAFILFAIITRVGEERYFSEIEGRFVTEFNDLSLLVGLLLLVVVAFFFLIFNATALANYLDQEKFTVFFEFNKLFKEISTNFKRNLLFAGNVFVLQFFANIIILMGFSLCIIPSLVANVLGTLAYYFMISAWAEKVNGPASAPEGGFDLPPKPKRGHDEDEMRW